MGVPAFFRWLSNRYPKVIRKVIEEKPTEINGITIPVDMSQPNPNGIEFDNFYLDMNGIIHPCCHPINRPAPETEADMMIEVFNCLDRVFSIIRPRKVIYMAIDGVAPRAKMNQQRSRRFRSAQDARIEAEEDRKVRDEMISRGLQVEDHKKRFDSNCITPGTPFMDNLAKCLRYYVAEKLNTDPSWKNLKIIISDASVPGEGEHKIMHFVRCSHMSPAHDPNTTHVIYGLDADLIMLALATHEPHFYILREDVFWEEGKKDACFKCKQPGHIARFCPTKQGAGKQEEEKPEPKNVIPIPSEKVEKEEQQQPFILAQIAVLREYLSISLKPQKQLPFPFDLERALDDWVFLCFFVGNDFLPHLPSLDIKEGALDKLMKAWRDQLPYMGGYITKSGEVDLSRVQLIMNVFAQTEDEVFKVRKKKEEQREARNKKTYMQEKGLTENENAQLYGESEESKDKNTKLASEDDKDNKDAAKKLKSLLLGGNATDNEKSKSESAKDKDEDEDEEEVFEEEVIMESGTSGKVEEDANGGKEDSSKKLKRKLSNDQSDDAEPKGVKAKKVKDEDDVDEELYGSDNDIKNNATDKKEDVDNGNGDDDLEKELYGSESSDTEKEKNDGETVDDEKEKVVEAETEDISSVATKDDKPELPEDDVRLWEDGYRERYYRQKLGVELSDREFIHDFVKCYVEGLCWVLLYYYQGCPSWKWYYPYHYSPFAVDFVDLESMDIKFELGEPFKPYEQLMGVLPQDSKENLPDKFWPLMTNEDSPIIDFYPKEFQIDLNGKKFAWQGVALLPFIDEKRLLSEINEVYPKLSEEERIRNIEGSTILCIAATNKLYESMCNLYSHQDEHWEALDPRLGDRFSGSVSKDPNFVPHTLFPSPLLEKGKPNITEDKSIAARYKPYTCTKFESSLLPGVKLGKKRLNSADEEFVRTGGKSGRRGGPGGPHYGNNHDYSFFYKQQGNDVYYDRGHGPRRYDERGNVIVNQDGHGAHQSPYSYQNPQHNQHNYRGGRGGRGGGSGYRGGRGASANSGHFKRQHHHHPYKSFNNQPPAAGGYRPSPPNLPGVGGQAPLGYNPGHSQQNMTASAFYGLQSSSAGHHQQQHHQNGPGYNNHQSNRNYRPHAHGNNRGFNHSNRGGGGGGFRGRGGGGGGRGQGKPRGRWTFNKRGH
ncbi:5'-3' exoribonuclease 2 [Mycoemilia scoparia]|uniref:5'-3' exoribonuclease n=1 Tax=Mycoemilia scoparia TaxID=417184 RepID=A0A9W7ZYR6_9FUNG|nr:5'-3' exoribonuclease 2 [Mycoemilia scoparia]